MPQSAVDTAPVTAKNAPDAVRPRLLSYNVKVLLALEKSIEGKDTFFQWLVENGYPELGAFSNFLHDDPNAEQFLVKTGNGWLGLLSHAIDGDKRALAWVKMHLHQANLMFALACREEEKAQSWLRFMKLDILLQLAEAVAFVRNHQELDRAFPYKYKF